MKTVPTRLDLIRQLSGDKLTGAEVGVMNGDFAAEILTLSNIDRLYLIDPWQHQPGPYEKDPANVDQGGQEERFRFVKERFVNDERVRILRMLSFAAMPLFIRSRLDFVYLDAAHDYRSVQWDLDAWSRIAPVLFVHDFIENEATDTMGFGVVRAVTKFCEESGWRVTALTDDDAWPTCELRKP